MNDPLTGEIVAVLTADGKWLRKVVVGYGGRDFPCWNVAWEDEFTAWTPWPIQDVVPLSERPDALTLAQFLGWPGASAEGET